MRLSYVRKTGFWAWMIAPMTMIAMTSEISGEMRARAASDNARLPIPRPPAASASVSAGGSASLP